MADRAISFMPAMIRALQAGRKTQTRRLWKPNGRVHAVGDRLWVQEGFRVDEDGAVIYRADKRIGGAWRQPQTMKRIQSRLALDVVDVKRQRLQDMTHADLEAEGIVAASLMRLTGLSPRRTAQQRNLWSTDDAWGSATAGDLLFPSPVPFWTGDSLVPCFLSPEDAFTALWRDVRPHGPHVEDNPEVWAITFEVVASPVVKAAMQEEMA
jgi:hypothetical protein